MSTSGDSAHTSNPPTTIPRHHLPHLFPTSRLPDRFAHRPQPRNQKPKPNLPPGVYGGGRLKAVAVDGGDREKEREREREEERGMRTLAELERRCPLFELVQYKCDVDQEDGVIRCLPVVRLFRKCKTVMVEVTELDKYQGYT